MKTEEIAVLELLKVVLGPSSALWVSQSHGVRRCLGVTVLAFIAP